MEMDENSSSSGLPDDTLFYEIYPDPVSSSNPESSLQSLQSLHLEIQSSISPFTTSYIWQHQPFTLSPSLLPPLPHLRGSLRYGDNLDDEWFAVFLLFFISSLFPSLSIRCFDSDGEFLLIESAFHLPSWLSPSSSPNRVFIRRGRLHIIPRRSLPFPTLADSLNFLARSPDSDSLAPDPVNSAILSRVDEYPDRARMNMHTVRVRVPVAVAHVLRHEPCLISAAVEGFYDRDVDSMKYAARMERFLGTEEDRELVRVAVRMSRTMYAQLVRQTFRAPKCYPRMPSRGETGGGEEAYAEAELGMKISCGFEMMYQMRKRDGEQGKGRSWEMYKESLERNGYFRGLLSGSADYKRLMGKAEEYYRSSSLFSKNRYLSFFRHIDDSL